MTLTSRTVVIALVAAATASSAPAATPRTFDTAAAWRLLRLQVAYGPRPAGSPASRRLAEVLRRKLPHGTFQAVPGGLRNVVGFIRGRDTRRYVVVGAHYDTKDIPGFVGANDGASGVAVVTQLARTVRPRELGPSVVFVLFDGEETPRGVPDSDFLARGDRGSKVAAARYRKAAAMVLLDMIGDRSLSIPREQSSSPRLWSRLRASARRVGTLGAFPAATTGPIEDDHTPFEQRGVPAIDLIDFTYPCWHQPCDDLDHVSARSLGVVGRTALDFLRRL